MRSKEETHKFVTMVAQKQGWDVNKDVDFRDILETGLMTNYQRLGFFQCPCRDSNGNRAENRDIICPCSYARQDIEEYGRCYCALFFKASTPQEGYEEPIPERRPEDLFN